MPGRLPRTGVATSHDPYPFMRWLREQDPVYRAESGLFLLRRHADIYGR